MTARTVLLPFVGDQLGGAQMSTLLLARHLDPARYVPRVLLHEADGPLARHLAAEGIAFAHLPLAAYAGAVPSIAQVLRAIEASLAPLARFLRRESIALVHGQDLRMNLTWLPAARLTGRPHVWHQRAVPTRSPLWRVATLGAARVICISRAVRTALAGGASGRVAVIDNPFTLAAPDRAAARAALIEELGLPQAARLVGFVGRLHPQKRPDLFVEAAARIAARVPDAHFPLAALRDAAEEADLLGHAERLGIAPRLHLLGFRHPVEPVLAALDVLLVTADTDGFGRTLVEAAGVGTPVVATDSGGHREALEAARFVVVPTAAALAEAALAALADDGALARAARDEVRARFSPQRHADAVMETYDRCFA